MDKTPNLDKQIIQLKFFNEMSEGEINALTNQLRINSNYYALKNFQLEIKGSDTKSFDLITTAYKDKRQELEDSKRIIDGLRNEVEDLKNTVSTLNQTIERKAALSNEKAIAFSRIAKEAKIRYLNIEKIGFSKVLSSSDLMY